MSDPIADIGCYASEVLVALCKLGHTDLTGIDLNPKLGDMPFQGAIKYEVSDFKQDLLVSHEDFRRRQADSLAKSVEGLLATVVTHKVSDILEQNHPQRIGDLGRFGPAVEFLKLIHNLLE